MIAVFCDCVICVCYCHTASGGISSGGACVGTGGSGEGREECVTSSQQSPGEPGDATG